MPYHFLSLRTRLHSSPARTDSNNSSSRPPRNGPRRSYSSPRPPRPPRNNHHNSGPVLRLTNPHKLTRMVDQTPMDNLEELTRPPPQRQQRGSERNNNSRNNNNNNNNGPTAPRKPVASVGGGEGGVMATAGEFDDGGYRQTSEGRYDWLLVSAWWLQNRKKQLECVACFRVKVAFASLGHVTLFC